MLITCNQVNGATSYPIQRSLDNVTFTALASPVVPQYIDTTVTVGTTYWYKIASSNGTVSAYTASQSIVPTLPGQMTLGQIRLLAKQKADRVNSQFVTDAEWNTYINQSYFELYDLLVQKYGNEYYVAAPVQFATTAQGGNAGNQFYPLPDGQTSFLAQDGSTFVPPAIYKLLGVDLAIGGTNSNAWITLQKFEFIARNNYLYPQLTSNLLGIAGLRYRMIGNNIEFIPQPAAGQFIQLWYIPRMTTLLLDSDIADGVSGWNEYIAVDAAIKALQKEESDVTVLMTQKAMLTDRIEAAAENRDAGAPEVISNTRRYTDLYGFGGPNGSGPFGGW